jgi:hypothetical protein
LSEDTRENDLSQLNKKLNAVLGLVFALGKKGFHWSTDWAVRYMSEFGVSEKAISEITGVTGEEARKAATKSKTSKVSRTPSFWERFKED